MAVTEVTLLPQRSGKWTSTWQRSYTLHYHVECDDKQDGPVVIRSALLGGNPWLPRIGAHYEVNATEKDLGSFVVEVSYETGEDDMRVDGIAWTVSYEFGPYDAAVFGENPVAWPMLVAFTQDQYQRIVLVDINGVPILNSAKCPYADPVQADDARSIITVKRNEAVGGLTPFDITKAETYRNSVNNAVWNGFAAKTVMCSSITTGDQVYDSNAQVYYYEVTYVFHLNRDTWTKQILDQGKQYLDSSGKPTKVRSPEGDDADEAVLLDGSGHQLASTGTPVFRAHEVYPALDFSVFNLDLSTALGF